MMFSVHERQQKELINLPETGMGYQVIEAKLGASYSSDRFLIFNSQVAISLKDNPAQEIKRLFTEGFSRIQLSLNKTEFSNIMPLTEVQFRSLVQEPINPVNKSAIENPVKYSNGKEQLARLSAFKDDVRIDKVNNRLLPGSFTTSVADYLICKSNKKDPVERYALPNNNPIEWVFFINPKPGDQYQQGIVQRANNKIGGGEEFYFAHGTSNGTYIPPEKPY